MNLKQAITEEAHRLGFSGFGVAPAEYDPIGHNNLLRWLEKGYHADMQYMERATRQRFDPKIHLPTAKSVIVCALNYYNKPENDPTKPYISLYARGENYHAVMKDKLDALCRKIAGHSCEGEFKVFADSAAFAEKWFAVKAGLGFIGRNGILILSRRSGERKARGSFYFLGVIISDLELEPDTSSAANCGDCRLCIETCPTGAIAADRVINATRCISYHTLQNKGDIPEEIASKMGNNLFGCDICQIVCPYNNKVIETDEPRLRSNPLITALDSELLLKMNKDDFERYFSKSSIGEKGFEIFKRNVLIAVKNIRSSL